MMPKIQSVMKFWVDSHDFPFSHNTHNAVPEVVQWHLAPASSLPKVSDAAAL